MTSLAKNLRAFLRAEEDWDAVSRGALIAWLVFYGLFLLHAWADEDGFLLLDNVNLVVHEGGHLLFRWFGATLTLYGGTLLQFLVPLALGVYFFRERKTTAVAFTAFWLFENCLYTSVYLGDARAQVLPLVTVGDPGAGGHDWFQILARWGLLRYDTTLAAMVRAVGWLGLLAVPAWLIHRQRRQIG
ncbi:MAG: hypothetical protein ACE5IP_13675 [Terriglobia bacterium]